MGKCKPGDIITIKGTEFAVLDIEKGTAKDGKDKLFVLLKEPFGSTPFSTDGNDYTESKLLDEVGRWEQDADGDWYCTNCDEVVAICESGRERTYRKPYCPNCGAKMDGGADND